MIEIALERSGYIDELRDERSIEAEGRLENLAELIGSAEAYETCEEFLEQVSLVSPTDELDDQSEVTLMTLHTAKGLEFPMVFIVGMEDGIFPSFMSLGDPDQLEEERRLAYVGITRAEEQLHLTLAESRWIYGQQQHQKDQKKIHFHQESRMGKRKGWVGEWQNCLAVPTCKLNTLQFVGFVDR